MSEAAERNDMGNSGWFPIAALGLALFSAAALVYWVGVLVRLVLA